MRWIMYMLIVTILSISCEEVERGKQESEPPRTFEWWKCVHKKDPSWELIEMSDYDKFVKISKALPNHKLYTIDGKSDIYFIAISNDTIVSDVNNIVVGSEIIFIEDNGYCDCSNHNYKARKYLVRKVHSYDRM